MLSRRLIIFLPFFKFGGVESLALKLVGLLKNDLIKIDIVCFSISSSNRQHMQKLGVSICILQTRNAYFRFFNLVILCVKRQAVFLILPTNHGVLIGFFLGIFRGLTVLVVDRAHTKSCNIKKWLMNVVSLNTLKLSSGVIFSYKGAFESYKRKLKESQVVRVIYHPVNAEFYKCCKSADFKYDLIYVGRLSQEKGIHLLLEAMEILQKKHEIYLNLAIVGDGIALKNLEELVKRLGLKKIYFLGFKKNIPQLLEQSRVMILPSLSEGCSGVTKEAVVAKTPVVVANVESGGPQEMIGFGKYGEIFSLSNSKSLAEKILTCLDRHNLNDFDEHHQKTISKMCDSDHVRSGYQEVLNQVYPIEEVR